MLSYYYDVNMYSVYGEINMMMMIGVRPAGQQTQAARDGGRSSAGPGRRTTRGTRLERRRRLTSRPARQRSAHFRHNLRQCTLVTLTRRLPNHSSQKVRNVTVF